MEEDQYIDSNQQQSEENKNNFQEDSLEQNNTQEENYERQYNQEELIQLLDVIKQRQKAFNKVKFKNNQLREELKEINNVLNKALQKAKLKKPEQKQQDSEEALHEEIKNANKQLAIYKNELSKIKEKEQNALDIDKIEKLERQLVQFDREFIDKQSEQKKLEKIIREHEKTIEALNNYKEDKEINSLTDEVKNLRDRAYNTRQKYHIQEKNFKSQQEYLTKIETKFVKVSNQFNEPAPNFEQINQMSQKVKQTPLEKKEEKQQKKIITVKDIRQADKDLEEDEAEQKNVQITQELIEKLVEKFKKMIYVREANYSKNQKQLDELQSKIVNLEFQNRELNNKILEKEKESHLAANRYQELNKKIKSTQLAPIDTNSLDYKKNYLATNKELIRACVSTYNRPVKRDAKGGVFTSQFTPFDDAYTLGESFNHRISDIIFYHNGKSIIYGIQVCYVLSSGEIHQGENHYHISTLDKTDVVVSHFKLQKDEYITCIEGVASDIIEYLKFETSYQKKFEVGVKLNFKGSNKQEFFLEPPNFFVPITLFGGLDTYKQSQSWMDQALCYIGVELYNPFVKSGVKPQQSAKFRNKSVDEVIPEMIGPVYREMLKNGEMLEKDDKSLPRGLVFKKRVLKLENQYKQRDWEKQIQEEKLKIQSVNSKVKIHVDETNKLFEAKKNINSNSQQNISEKRSPYPQELKSLIQQKDSQQEIAKNNIQEIKKNKSENKNNNNNKPEKGKAIERKDEKSNNKSNENASQQSQQQSQAKADQKTPIIDNKKGTKKK